MVNHIAALDGQTDGWTVVDSWLLEPRNKTRQETVNVHSGSLTFIKTEETVGSERETEETGGDRTGDMSMKQQINEVTQ